MNVRKLPGRRAVSQKFASVIEKLECRQLLSGSTPFTGTPFAPNQTILAVDYDKGGEGVAYHDTTKANLGGDNYRSSDSVDIEAGGSTGNVVGYTAAGEWLDYTVNIPTAGKFTLQASAANVEAGGSFHAAEGTTNLTGALAVPQTTGWQTYATVTSPAFSLPAGTQVLQIFLDKNAPNGAVGNFDWFKLVPQFAPPPGVDSPFLGTPFTTNQTILAVDYDKGGEGVAYHDTTAANLGGDNYRSGDGVDIQAGGSTGNVVAYAVASEWLDYTINVPTAGTYTLQASVANQDAGGSFHAEFDGTNLAGTNLTGAMSIPKTAGWQTYTTISSGSFSLPAGTTVMRIVLDQDAPNNAVGNFDWFKLVPASSSGGSSQPLVWKTVANAPIGVFEAHGVAVDGNLYVFGGFNASSPQYESTNESEAYNPATNKWAVLAPLPVMESHTSVATDGTYIYVAGGYTYNPKTTYQTFGTTDVFRYDIATNTWSDMAPLPSPRGGGELDFLDGELHYIGGNDGVDPTATKYAETNHWTLDLSNPSAQWVNAVSLPAPRSHMASAVVDGQIYIMGGRPTGADMVDPTTTLYIWNPNNPDVWSLGAPLLQPRAVSTAAVYNGEIYLISGTTTNYQIISTVDVYDPTTNTWTTQTSIPAGRFAPVAGVVGNTLIVTGGFSFANNGIFETTTWTATL